MAEQIFIILIVFLFVVLEGLARNIISENWKNINTKPSVDMNSFYENIVRDDKTENYATTSTEWITVDSPLCELILETFSDFDKRRIVNMISEKPLTIPEILYRCKIPSTAGYRKINSLIKEGIIVASGFVSVQNRKKVKRYKSIIEDAKIFIDKQNISVKVRLKKQ